jgi:hypothetical protein
MQGGVAVRRAAVVAMVVAILGVTACSKSTSTPAASAPSPTPSAAPSTSPSGDGSGYGNSGNPTTVDAELAGQLAAARAATGKYVTDLKAAQADGYKIITMMMPGMGYHYMNAGVQGFDVTKPAILVYVKNGGNWQLGALEWVWPEQPAKAPLDGATYGTFDAACHFQDGTFVAAAAQSDCAKTAPGTGSPFSFWHPKLVTLHVWLWYDNPAGLYSSMNPLVQG